MLGDTQSGEWMHVDDALAVCYSSAEHRGNLILLPSKLMPLLLLLHSTISSYTYSSSLRFTCRACAPAHVIPHSLWNARRVEEMRVHHALAVRCRGTGAEAKRRRRLIHDGASGVLRVRIDG